MAIELGEKYMCSRDGEPPFLVVTYRRTPGGFIDVVVVGTGERFNTNEAALFNEKYSSKSIDSKIEKLRDKIIFFEYCKQHIQDLEKTEFTELDLQRMVLFKEVDDILSGKKKYNKKHLVKIVEGTLS